jgi:glycosyltransferase involved in cell wall biosynthesis
MTKACPRILFVTPVSPFSSASGSEQRSALMLSALCSVGDVDVLQLRHGETGQVSAENQNGRRSVLALVEGADLAFSRYQPKLALTHDIERALGCEISGYQLIVGRYVWPVCQLAIPETVPVIVDLDDFRFRYSSESSWSWDLAKERLAKALAHRLVRMQLNRFKGAFTVSAQDRRDVSGLPTAFLPNVPISTCVIPTPVPRSKNILFVGSLWYRPNADGIDWFLSHVWQHVCAREPAATLTLVGAASQTARARWAVHPGVSAPGFVKDLAATYQCANLVVVPIQSGGGTNIKVLEAMAHGRPCLVSSFVATAFDGLLTGDKEMLVAGNAKEFVAKTLSALGVQTNLQRVADAGYVVICEHFTSAQFKSCVTDFVQTVCATETSGRGTL